MKKSRATRRAKEMMNERYISYVHTIRGIRKQGYTIPLYKYCNQLDCYLSGLVYGCALNPAISEEEFYEIRNYAGLLRDRFETRFPDC